MNILEIEDMVKGLPDQALQKEAQQPTGQIPQFLVVSEIQRRGDMRQRFQKRQENQGTVKDQVMQQGIAAMGAPQPEMQARWRASYASSRHASAGYAAAYASTSHASRDASAAPYGHVCWRRGSDG